MRANIYGRIFAHRPTRAGKRRTRIWATLAVAISLIGSLVAFSPLRDAFAAGTTKDTCGYPDASSNLSSTVFNENTVTRWAQVNGTDPSTATISVYSNDEWGVLLGVGPNVSANVPASQTTLTSPLVVNINYTTLAVAALPSPITLNDTITLNNGLGKTQNVKASANVAAGATSIPVVLFKANGAYANGSTVNDITHSLPGHVTNPNLGNPALLDASNRPQFPALYITDRTSNSSARDGDWQQGGAVDNLSGGVPFANDIFGSWATANIVGGVYTGVKPPLANSWNLGPGSDAPVAGATLGTDEGYGSEVRWNVSALNLTPGHKYRLQIITHDGDQNKTGGDTGEFCTELTLPGPPGLTTDVKGGTSGQNAAASITVPAGTTVTDTLYLAGTAGLGNVTGSATAHLYFVPNGTVVNPITDACTSQYEVNSGSSPPDANFPDLEALTVGSPSYAVSKSHNVGTALGTYYWQWVYPGQGNYTAVTEDCGAETVTVAKPRLRLDPYNASNVLGFPHTITATLDYTTDGTTYVPISGASVAWTKTGSATYLSGFGTPCTTNGSGQCSVKITDTVAETVTIGASSTGFTASPAVTGTFGSVSTSSHSTCNGAADGDTTTCDATKTYQQPSTTMTVVDHLVGLPGSANGTVSYTTYTSKANCLAKSGGTSAGGGAVTNGTADPSSSVDVAAGGESWFTATFSDGTTSYTTDCIESVSNHA